jgi:hypothetical protein
MTRSDAAAPDLPRGLRHEPGTGQNPRWRQTLKLQFEELAASVPGGGKRAVEVATHGRRRVEVSSRPALAQSSPMAHLRCNFFSEVLALNTARITSRSSMQSAPPAIPATIAVSFPDGFTPAEATLEVLNLTRCPISSDRPVRSAKPLTGTRPAHDTRCS